jgi:cytochrome c551/c552
MAAIVVALGTAQFVRLPATNPPVRGDLIAPPEAKDLIQRACYDCHSNETEWPWYSRVAPLSWLASSHVIEARERLNFSDWTDYAYDPGTEARKLGEMAKLIRSGAMPPWSYRLMHPRARLTGQERETVMGWIEHEQAVTAQRRLAE